MLICGELYGIHYTVDAHGMYVMVVNTINLKEKKIMTMWPSYIYKLFFGSLKLTKIKIYLQTFSPSFELIKVQKKMYTMHVCMYVCMYVGR